MYRRNGTGACGHRIPCPAQSPAEGLNELDIVVHDQDRAVFGCDARWCGRGGP
jgi:hypothetical protein